MAHSLDLPSPVTRPSHFSCFFYPLILGSLQVALFNQIIIFTKLQSCWKRERPALSLCLKVKTTRIHKNENVKGDKFRLGTKGYFFSVLIYLIQRLAVIHVIQGALFNVIKGALTIITKIQRRGIVLPWISRDECRKALCAATFLGAKWNVVFSSKSTRSTPLAKLILLLIFLRQVIFPYSSSDN